MARQLPTHLRVDSTDWFDGREFSLTFHSRLFPVRARSRPDETPGGRAVGAALGREGDTGLGPPSRLLFALFKAGYCEDQAGVLSLRGNFQSENGVVSQFFLPRGPLVIRRAGSGCG